MNFKKIIMLLVASAISIAAFSQKNQSLAMKTDGQVTSAQEELITNMFLYLNKFWADKGRSLSLDITKQYFDPDTTLIINGKTVYTGYAQLETHFKEVGKNIRGNIRFPLLEVAGLNNKVIVHFDEDIYDNNGAYFPANVMAIFTFRNGKILRWEEVANSKYFCQAESEKVVYSK